MVSAAFGTTEQMVAQVISWPFRASFRVVGLRSTVGMVARQEESSPSWSRANLVRVLELSMRRCKGLVIW